MKNTSLYGIFQYLSVMIALCIKSECWLYKCKLQNMTQVYIIYENKGSIIMVTLGTRLG